MFMKLELDATHEARRPRPDLTYVGVCFRVYYTDCCARRTILPRPHAERDGRRRFRSVCMYYCTTYISRYQGECMNNMNTYKYFLAQFSWRCVDGRCFTFFVMLPGITVASGRARQHFGLLDSISNTRESKTILNTWNIVYAYSRWSDVAFL